MRVATTPEAIAMTNDTAAITPLKLSGAFKGSNQALFSTGYQKIPGGLIFQWGGAEVPAASSLTLPLSIAFPSYGIRSIASFNGFVSTSVKSLGSAFANSSQIVLWNGDPNSALNISFLAVGV